eukprot:jgi/Psemu1/5973/gm1.5973_g
MFRVPESILKHRRLEEDYDDNSDKNGERRFRSGARKPTGLAVKIIVESKNANNTNDHANDHANDHDHEYDHEYEYEYDTDLVRNRSNDTHTTESSSGIFSLQLLREIYPSFSEAESVVSVVSEQHEIYFDDTDDTDNDNNNNDNNDNNNNNNNNDNGTAFHTNRSSNYNTGIKTGASDEDIADDEDTADLSLANMVYKKFTPPNKNKNKKKTTTTNNNNNNNRINLVSHWIEDKPFDEESLRAMSERMSEGGDFVQSAYSKGFVNAQEEYILPPVRSSDILVDLATPPRRHQNNINNTTTNNNNSIETVPAEAYDVLGKSSRNTTTNTTEPIVHRLPGGNHHQNHHHHGDNDDEAVNRSYSSSTTDRNKKPRHNNKNNNNNNARRKFCFLACCCCCLIVVLLAASVVVGIFVARNRNEETAKLSATAASASASAANSASSDPTDPPLVAKEANGSANGNNNNNNNNNNTVEPTTTTPDEQSIEQPNRPSPDVTTAPPRNKEEEQEQEQEQEERPIESTAEPTAEPTTEPTTTPVQTTLSPTTKTPVQTTLSPTTPPRRPWTDNLTSNHPWATLINYVDPIPESFFPLGQCVGDCDKDADCAEGLVCFQRRPNDPVPFCHGGENDFTRTDYCTHPGNNGGDGGGDGGGGADIDAGIDADADADADATASENGSNPPPPAEQVVVGGSSSSSSSEECSNSVSVVPDCYFWTENVAVVDFKNCNPQDEDWIGVYPDGTAIEDDESSVVVAWAGDDYIDWAFTCGNIGCAGSPTTNSFAFPINNNNPAYNDLASLRPTTNGSNLSQFAMCYEDDKFAIALHHLEEIIEAIFWYCNLGSSSRFAFIDLGRGQRMLVVRRSIQSSSIRTVDQLGVLKTSNPAPVGNNNNNSQQQQAGGRSRYQNRQGNNNTNGGGNAHPSGERKFSGLDQDELKRIIINGSKSVQYDKLYEGLKIVGGKKNSKVKTTLISMTPLAEDDFLPTMPSPADYTILGTRMEEVIDPNKKQLLEELWVKKGERSAKKYDQYVEDLTSLFSTTEGQLSPEVKKQRLKMNESWTDIEDGQDTLSMLKLLKEYCYRDSATKVHPMVDVANKIYRFFSCMQDTNKSAATYTEEVKARFDAMTLAGIPIRSEAMITLALRKAFPGTSYTDYTKMDASSKAKVDTLMEDMLLSVVIVNRCNTKTHHNLSVPKALELMNQYKSTNNTGCHGSTGTSTTNNTDKASGTTNETVLTSNVITTPTTGGSKVSESHQILMAGVADGAFDDESYFFQLSTTITTPHPTPEKSKSVGTHAINAINAIEDYNISNELEYMFLQSNGSIDPYCILLDSQATCNCVSNPALLKDIQLHPEGRKVQIHCNAGVVIVDMVEELPGFGIVWFQEGGMANILSLSSVSDQYCITLDTAITQSFFVHKETDGTILAITSVEGKKKLYSDLDVRWATKAQKLQDAMGFPSIKDYLKMINNNLLLNCPVTRQDIKIAEDIFGPNTSVVKGKAVRQQPTHAVALSIDIFTVNGIKFFRSVSRHLYFRTVCAIEDASQSTILQTLATIIGLYATLGLVVTVVSGDNEFNCLEEALLSRNPLVQFEGERMTRDEVKRALPYLMFLKRKRCGKIKACGCADG